LPILSVFLGIFGVFAPEMVQQKRTEGEQKGTFATCLVQTPIFLINYLIIPARFLS
jgi:hypothetical protein